MVSRRQPGTDFKSIPRTWMGESRRRASSPPPRPRRIYGLLISLYLVGVAAFAETPLRNSFDSADMILMGQTNLAYTSCLQDNAREHVASSPDIRVIAGNAVESCSSILAELQTALTDNGVNPEFFTGAVERIKNGAIRRLLPLLMMEKSNQP